MAGVFLNVSVVALNLVAEVAQLAFSRTVTFTDLTEPSLKITNPNMVLAIYTQQFV